MGHFSDSWSKSFRILSGGAGGLGTAASSAVLARSRPPTRLNMRIIHRWPASQICRAGLASMSAVARRPTLLLRCPAATWAGADRLLSRPAARRASVPLIRRCRPIPDDAAIPRKCPRRLTTAPYDPDNFRPGPDYRNKPYSAEDQYAIYGLKTPNPTQLPAPGNRRRALRLWAGRFRPISTWPWRGKNPGVQHSGCTAIGERHRLQRQRKGRRRRPHRTWPLRQPLNLDIDYQFTSTERIHLFVRPLDKDNQNHPLRLRRQRPWAFQPNLNFNVDALFFEGDLGAITQAD